VSIREGSGCAGGSVSRQQDNVRSVGRLRRAIAAFLGRGNQRPQVPSPQTPHPPSLPLCSARKKPQKQPLTEHRLRAEKESIAVTAQLVAGRAHSNGSSGKSSPSVHPPRRDQKRNHSQAGDQWLGEGKECSAKEAQVDAEHRRPAAAEEVAPCHGQEPGKCHAPYCGIPRRTGPVFAVSSEGVCSESERSCVGESQPVALGLDVTLQPARIRRYCHPTILSRITVGEKADIQVVNRGNGCEDCQGKNGSPQSPGPVGYGRRAHFVSPGLGSTFSSFRATKTNFPPES